MLLLNVSLGFDKFIFIKNTSQTAFYSNLQTHVVDISLFCVFPWYCGLIQNVLLNWCAVCMCVCMTSRIHSAVFV